MTFFFIVDMETKHIRVLFFVTLMFLMFAHGHAKGKPENASGVCKYVSQDQTWSAENF